MISPCGLRILPFECTHNKYVRNIPLHRLQYRQFLPHIVNIRSRECQLYKDSKYTKIKPRTLDSSTPRGSSSIPTLVMDSIECCRTAGDSSWISSTSGAIADSACPIGNAEACVAAFPNSLVDIDVCVETFSQAIYFDVPEV